MDTQIAENLQAQLAEVGINMGIRQWNSRPYGGSQERRV